MLKHQNLAQKHGERIQEIYCKKCEDNFESCNYSMFLEEIEREIQEEKIYKEYTLIEIDKEFYNFKRGI